MEFDTKNGLWYRPERLDLSIIKEQVFNKNLNFTPADTMLDLGAHIGSTAKLALDAGIGFVICVEPEPDNFRMLQHNLAAYPNVWLYHAAVVAGTHTASTVNLFVNSGKGGASHSLCAVNRRQTIPVPAWKFHTLVWGWRPTILKIDIEGYEFELLEDMDGISEFVRAISLEIHTSRPEWAEQIPAFRERLGLQFRQRNPAKIIVAGRFGSPTIWYRR